MTQQFFELKHSMDDISSMFTNETILYAAYTRVQIDRLLYAFRAAEDITAFINLVFTQEENKIDFCYFLRKDMEAPLLFFRSCSHGASSVSTRIEEKIGSILKEMAETLEQRVLYIQERLTKLNRCDYDFKFGKSLEKIKEEKEQDDAQNKKEQELFHKTLKDIEEKQKKFASMFDNLKIINESDEEKEDETAETVD